MEFINQSDEQYEIVECFKNIENSSFQDLTFDEKIDLLKSALRKNTDEKKIKETLIFF